MKNKKKIIKKRYCKKCGDRERCHSCGSEISIHNGYIDSWQNTKNGPWHYLCERCGE